MPYVSLGNTGSHALVDQQDFGRVARHTWAATSDSRRPNVYARRRYAKGGRYHWQRLSHFILDLPATVKVRHLNNNTLDCRRENLRVGGASIITNRESRRNPYRVKCSYRNRQIVVGGFPTTRTAEAAVSAVSARLLEINRGPALDAAEVKRLLQEAAGVRVTDEEEGALAA